MTTEPATTAPRDPRPLVGEPLSLDLLNTRWMADGVRQDLLAGTEGLAVWLAANGLGDRFGADEATLEHVLRARDAIASVVDGPDPNAGIDRVNKVLDHGRIRATLSPEGPGEKPEFKDVTWGAAWLAARDYLTLLATAQDRIRPCAHEACILHFFDTSRNGTRRWCSMAACGNRAKASRHYARARPAR
ncbi:CGNR zinc finger domain-containing protein [Streptomyces sp. NPDC048436]|uniref:CGNR zinc finger domain-containing protein n=1 Tax=Streptomyces sp. NPDC048436 TaxID=3365550 RepID=UPI00371B592D